MFHHVPKPDTQNWFAAQLKPNGLRMAEANLTRQGFLHFAPKRLETTRRGDRMQTAARSLFPGYILVQFDPGTSSWRTLNATRGISRLIVGDPRRPKALPQEFMAAMLARSDDQGIFCATPALAEGDLVRVISGPFADLVARIDKLAAEDRVQLLLDLMGRETRTSVSARFLEKVAT